MIQQYKWRAGNLPCSHPLTILIRTAVPCVIIHVLFFVCSVSLYNQQAQAMSGIGVGSAEMHSVLVDNSQLQPLHLMLNDLKTKIGYRAS